MEKDKCILCNKETPYDSGTHIDFRDNYVEGAGQLCNECWDRTYERPELEDVE